MNSRVDKQKFIGIQTSQYVPLNPDTSAQSVPLNAHFEFIVYKFQNSVVKYIEDSFTEKKETGTEIAKPVPTVILSGLATGINPLFGNNNEVEAFADSLIVEGKDWSKSFNKGMDKIEFFYHGQTKTLTDDFIFRVYSDAFNTSAAYTDKAVINVESKNFASQFAQAFDDNYSISVPKIYVPSILYFKPYGMEPISGKPGEYSVKFGQKVLLTWEMKGDSLKSPVLTENGGMEETVSFNTPVERLIYKPTIFQLSVESNVLQGWKRSCSIEFDMETPPKINQFGVECAFCLMGSSVNIDLDVEAALSCTVTVQNSTEKKFNVSVDDKFITVYPVLEDEQKRIVTYTLNANGFLGKNPATVNANVDIYVSKWKKTESKSTIPLHSESDGVVRVFEFLGNYYCFSAGCVWKCSEEGKWEKIAVLPKEKEMSTCLTVTELYETELYIVAESKGSVLYIIKYNLKTDKWSERSVFGPDISCAGGAFELIDSERLYYFAQKDNYIECYIYYDGSINIWSIIGRIKLSAKVLAVDCILYKGYLYIAAACENKNIYIYRADIDLQKSEPPLIIKDDSNWIRLIKADGRAFLLSNHGIYNVDDGKQIDMFFGEKLHLLGLIQDCLVGIAANGTIWTLNF